MSSRFFLIAVCLCLGAVAARAELVGIGLDFRKGIFIQEYWQDGKPYYMVANLGKKAVQISVAEWKSGMMLAGPWDVKAESVGKFDASKIGGNALVAVRLGNGTSLGLLSPPAGPAETGKGVLASHDGMNGSGGRHTEIWCEQAKSAYKSDEVIELKLKVPSGAGIIKYGTEEEKSFIAQLPLREAVCETLPVKTVGNQVHIFANQPLKAEKLHTVTLRFRAPMVTAPTMVMVSGWRAISAGGGHGITRGVVVEP